MSAAPTVEDWAALGFVSGNTTYICKAKSFATERTVTVSAVTAGAITLLTATGHGFDSEQRPMIRITGSTGANWQNLNASWPATYVDANTLSVALNSTGYGSYTGTISVKTNAPSTLQPVWKITRANTDGTNFKSYMTAVGYQACADRATASIAWQ
jgi:hypothetical protein